MWLEPRPVRDTGRARTGRARIAARGWVTLAALALAGQLAAQPGKLRFERITVEDGLSHGAVWAMEQDSLGFLWIGTQEGLNRYDGYRFKVFRHHPDHPDSLSESEVLALHEDRSGGLWVGTRGGGLNRFHRAEERFEHFRHDAGDASSLGHDSVWSLLEDSSGTLWVGTEDGLGYLRQGAGGFARIPDAAGASSGRTVLALHEDSSGVLWIGTDGGLDRLDHRRQSLVSYRHEASDPASLSRGAVRAIEKGSGGSLWIGTATALCRFDPRAGTCRRFRHDPADPGSLSDDEVRALHLDRQDRLWIGTETGGLNRLDPGAGAFIAHRHDPAAPGTLSQDSIIAMFEDSTGVLWFGSYLGLNKHDPASERFVTYRQHPGHEQTLSSRAIWPVLEDGTGALWIGTYESGLDRIDRRRGTVDHYQPDPRDPESMPHGTVSSLWEDSSGVLWVGTWGGLARFDRDRERLKTYRHDPANPDSLRNEMVVALREDSAGRFWVGTLQGLHRFDRARERFIRYPHRASDPDSLGQDWIYSIYEDRQGAVWFGALGGGLYRLTESGNGQHAHFAHYRHRAGDRDSLSSNKIASLYQDRSGRLWVGTFGGGLNRLAGDAEPGSERFVHYREEDGLPNNTVLGILEDDGGRLWLSTNGGLSRLDPEAETFRSYDVDDGLPGNVFSPGSCFRGAGGEMFFGGIEGLSSFYPDRITTDPHPPAVVITDFQLFDESAALRRPDRESPLEQSILETSELELSHRHPVISFEFAALHFAKPRKNRYAYRLEGFDRDWIATDASRRFARYTNLAPGRYTFRVRGSNGDGLWSPHDAALRIVVRPPPWKSWWAYGVYALTLAAAIGGYLRRHRREVEHERAINRRLQAADAVKEELISELGAKNAELERFTYTVSHDLKTPLITIQGFLGFIRQDAVARDLGRLDEDIRRIDGAVDKMRRLLEELLDLSRVGRLMNEPQAVVLGDLFREATELLAGRIAESGARIEIAPDLPVVFGDRARIFQVAQNLLENAIKYADGVPRIEVATRRPEPPGPGAGDPVAGDPVVVVRDHGIGIGAGDLDQVFGLFRQLDPGRDGTGIGLTLVQRIVEVHGGRIWVESEGRGHGSSFCFTLPAPRTKPAA